MGVLRAKAVAIATLSTLIFISACAPAAEGGPTPTESESAEASPSPSASPSASVTPSDSPEPTSTPKARPTDEPAGEDHESESSTASTWKYRWAATDGYPTYYPEVLPPTNDDGTVGSGCHPPDSDTLPDGVWRGLVYDKAFQETPLWIKFDLVCSYSFQYPGAPEGQHGDWSYDSDWDYVITNNNADTRVLTVASAATGHGYDWDWAPVVWDKTWLGCGLGCDTWIWINDGEVTELAAAYNWSTDHRDAWNGAG